MHRKLLHSQAAMLTRREFLKVGAGGALVLGAARIIRTQAATRDDRLAPRVLDDGAGAILAAVVPVLLAGALPTAPAARSARIAATITGVDSAIAELPPHAQSELRDLFALLGFAPVRRLFAGVASPWPEASPAAVADFLQSWRSSTWSLKQQAYHALHALVFAAFYADPASWPAIGYPGPPRLD
jgi:hypothetical protein